MIKLQKKQTNMMSMISIRWLAERASGNQAPMNTSSHLPQSRPKHQLYCIYISRGGFLSISYLHHLTCHEPDQNISYLIDVTFCLVDSRTNLLVGNLHIFMEYFVWGKIVASGQKNYMQARYICPVQCACYQC